MEIVNLGEGQGAFATAFRILVMLTAVSLIPTVLVLFTSFTRVVVVLSFVRNAVATAQVPPNLVLIGLAIFITFYVMAPTWNQVYQGAVEPYLRGEMDEATAYRIAMRPIRDFMLKQTREKDIALFMDEAHLPKPATPDDVPTYCLVPAFAISELRRAFQIGFFIFVPFLIVDMVVASILMSMGMLMLPPMLVSLPFKILLFVLVDGWYLVCKSLIESFR